VQRRQGVGGLLGGVGGNTAEALLLVAESFGILDQFQDQNVLLGIVRAEPGQVGGDSIFLVAGEELLINGGFAGQRLNAVGTNSLLQQVAAVRTDDPVVAIAAGIVEDSDVSVDNATRRHETAGQKVRNYVVLA
jgi:hypothetical protein